ncbi:hypothetical protein GN956_G14965 [Arapaima gigas]
MHDPSLLCQGADPAASEGQQGKMILLIKKRGENSSRNGSEESLLRILCFSSGGRTLGGGGILKSKQVLGPGPPEAKPKAQRVWQVQEHIHCSQGGTLGFERHSGVPL